MGAFEYLVLDGRGREKKGVMEGDTARQVRQNLREQGLTPLQVEEVTRRESRSQGRGGLTLRRKISATDLALITRQLATLVQAGMPLEETLQTVARQTESPRVKSLLLAVRSKVMEGYTLADGLGEFPHIFPEIYRTTVAAGEQSGHLDVVLERLADYTEGRQQMRAKISQALIYPVILTMAALGITIFLLTYVVPEVVQVFEDSGQELPWLTTTLISLSDFVRAYGIYLFIAFAALVAGALSLLKREAVRYRWHLLLHRLPLITKLMRGLNTARFARTLSILAASGVPILEALRIASEVLASLPMRRAVETAIQLVREGKGIARSLEQGGYFPPMALHLIASGESSGNLESMLERSADNQERELNTVISALMALMEPLLIVVMAAIVLTIVLAIMLPILDMNQLVQ